MNHKYLYLSLWLILLSLSKGLSLYIVLLVGGIGTIYCYKRIGFLLIGIACIYCFFICKC